MPKTKLNDESRFSKAPPGYSLTQAPGKWAWEKPPRYTTPAEAIDSVIKNLENPDVRMMQAQLLFAGVSIEELVNVAVKMGFMEGLWTVDVAELIKAPLAFYFMALAKKLGINAKVFNTKNGLPRRRQRLSDAQILNIMRDRNPDFAKYILQNAPKEARAKLEKKETIKNSSFIGVEE